MKRISIFGIYQSQLKGLKQTDLQLGCIPTNIAAALQAYGVRNASENGIQTAYRYAICFEKVKSGVLGKLEEVIGQNLSSRFELEHQAGIRGYDEWWQKLTDCISRKDAPVIFPYNVNGGCHVVTAIGYDDEKVEIYDPWPDNPKEILTVPTSELKNKWDSGKIPGEILAVRQKQSSPAPESGPEADKDMEQEARIALLEHFRSAMQHWATVLVALAITFFSVLQFKSEIEKLLTWLSPLGGADFLAVLVVMQGIYGTYRMVINGMLGELVVDPKTVLSDEDKGSTCFVRLYNAVVNRIFKGMGHGLWFCLNRWGGWVACTVLFAAGWIILMHWCGW